jgi:hypothetical protein
MQRHHVKRLPVVRGGKLAGIVSRADIIRQLASLLSSKSNTAGDGTIRNALLADVARQPWASRNMAHITVTDGVVQLDGCLFDMNQREALGVLAENTPGVKKVENRIVCIEPNLGAVIYDPAEVGGRTIL